MFEIRDTYRVSWTVCARPFISKVRHGYEAIINSQMATNRPGSSGTVKLSDAADLN